MKKNIKLIIGIILILIVIVVLLVIFLPRNRKGSKPVKGNYKFDNNTIELPGTQKYTSDILSSEHCLDGICISDVVFYYNDTEGRVEYTITNKSDDSKSGYLKMIFDNQELLVSYNNLEASKSIKTTSQYVGIKINNMDDYRLGSLSKEEIKNIK